MLTCWRERQRIKRGRSRLRTRAYAIVRPNLLSAPETLGKIDGRPHVMSALAVDMLSCCIFFCDFTYLFEVI